MLFCAKYLIDFEMFEWPSTNEQSVREGKKGLSAMLLKSLLREGTNARRISENLTGCDSLLIPLL